MNRFLKSIADVLEVAEVTPETEFRKVPEWCSLKAFGLLVAMENDWLAPITVDRLAAMETVKDLYREAFLALAARVFGLPREGVDEGMRYSSIPQWDSVNHLRLVMESEKFFGISFPLERIPFLSAVDDFLQR